MRWCACPDSDVVQVSCIGACDALEFHDRELSNRLDHVVWLWIAGVMIDSAAPSAVVS
jgi:hypothetical protein